MKPVDFDRLKISNYPFVRRKMSKVVNGAEDALKSENALTLSATYDDHLQCNIADLAKIEKQKEIKARSPCETDHIYANCSENKKSHYPPSNTKNRSTHWKTENKNLGESLEKLLHEVDSLKRQLEEKDKELMLQKQENEQLRLQLDELSLKNTPNSFIESNPCCSSVPLSTTTPLLATRYFGRKSKTVPSRALKRRYLGPPKSPIPKVASKNSAAEYSTDAESPPMVVDSIDAASPELQHEKTVVKRHLEGKLVCDYLTSPTPYLPEATVSVDRCKVKVPNWVVKKFPNFYQIEGTENTDDPVFEKKHSKLINDERRRKKMDVRRYRERIPKEEPAKSFNSKELEKNEDFVPHSMNPNDNLVEGILLTDALPVVAFGSPVPLLQECDFAESIRAGLRPELEEVMNPSKVKRVRRAI